MAGVKKTIATEELISLARGYVSSYRKFVRQGKFDEAKTYHTAISALTDALFLAVEDEAASDNWPVTCKTIIDEVWT